MTYKQKVLIADDHAVVRAGLRQILSETVDMAAADEAANGSEVLDKIGSGDFDLVLLDISMPGRNGLDVLKEIRHRQPRLPVLILSMHAEEQYALRALRSGAAGYVTKESAPEELVAAIRKILLGKKFVSASLAEALVAGLGAGADQPLHEALSDREHQVLCLIASGKAAGEIARELSLSVKTVSTYRARILAKMKMKSNAELTRYALTHRLVE